MNRSWRACLAAATLVLAGCQAASAPTAQPAGLARVSAAPQADLGSAAAAVPTPTATAAGPSADAASAVPPTPEPLPSQPTPTKPPAPESTDGETYTPTPTPTPVPVPAVGISLGTSSVGIVPGEAFVAHALRVRMRNVDRTRCRVTQTLTPDKPGVEAYTRTLDVVTSQTVRLEDGYHEFRVSCPSVNGTLKAAAKVLARDGQPEKCLDFAFADAPTSATTFDALRSGMVGEWEGCVTTPWTPAYWVTMSLREDGTYSVTSKEALDGVTEPAFYYGSDADSPNKRWALNDIQASNKGVGQIDLTWGDDTSNITRGDLRNIELMGDRLRFEYFHFATYGPVTFQLTRVAGG